MTLTIITHVSHIIEQEHYFAYSPYVREMNIWNKYASKVIIVAPISKLKKTDIDIAYQHQNITFLDVPSFNLLSIQSIFRTVFRLPKVCFQIFKAMKLANHIHLRCPGNMGLLGSFIQILFPFKTKTAKYAGNWDPKEKQPLSYKLQKYILSNTFLTRNMQVLVYGDWESTRKNIKPFFTATYSEKDKTPIVEKNIDAKINIVFVGTLVTGKNPIYAIQIVEKLVQLGHQVHLDIFGDGNQKTILEDYILLHGLQDIISVHGNQTQENIKNAYQKSHFVILPSQSEGWPKVIAEGMFWGCVPIATSVSCVPFMLDYGERGVLLQLQLEEDIKTLNELFLDKKRYKQMQFEAVNWSRKYTLDVFEQEIMLLLQA
jgi:glycosyltransferase involved in cell wall biosynthesis